MWPGRFYFTFTAFAFGVIEIKQNIFSTEAYKTSIITGVFLKPTINRASTTDQLPTDQPSTYHQPPTNQLPNKCPNNQPTDHRPKRNLRTKNSITNFKWISDEKNVRSCYKYNIENVSNYLSIKARMCYR